MNKRQIMEILFNEAHADVREAQKEVNDFYKRVGKYSTKLMTKRIMWYRDEK